MLDLEVYWNERPLVSKSTYKGEKMVEVAMRLSQEDLNKTLASPSRLTSMLAYSVC